MAQPVAVSLQELHDPETGRLDASQFADYLKVPLKQMAQALGKSYPAVHKTPSAPDLQPSLRSIKRILEILEQVFPTRAAVLAWLNNPHADLGRRTPLEVILEGYPVAVEDMLEAALIGLPS
ncbi:MAG TPA: antitoxin Xre/MbcA/ParS toxin-binding domain-containing protein [Thermoanaerobaculia bacterium]|nr:antitoxin Xre/MbcA/ParS toxin-binding domain-containing protein [Thermoanaerobaculia bacterium]